MAGKTDYKHTILVLVLCALFAALIAVGAFIKIPMFGVPFTLQTFFCILAGLLLGADRGALAVGVYIFIGLAGIPVFTNGGGPGYIFQPSFGYIMGFFFGTYAAGRIAHAKRTASAARFFVAGFIGVLIVYVIGMTYLYIISNFYLHKQIGLDYVLVYCFLLLLPGDVFKCFVAAILAKRLYPAVQVYLDKKNKRPYY
ncbi:MAG: biotin transporter BioY [Bacillota bacterium]